MPEAGVSEEGVGCKIIFLWRLKRSEVKKIFFVRIDVKHSYFCLQSIISVVETVVLVV